MKPIVLVDAGNTRLKWRVAGCPEKTENLLWEDLHKAQIPSAEPGAVAYFSSVRSITDTQQLVDRFTELNYRVVHVQVRQEVCGLKCGYKDISQLGVDRWLAMLHCYLVLQKSFLLVSAGTALTLDQVDDDGQHKGSLIIPGMTLQRESLFARSQKLAALGSSIQTAELKLGTNTSAAIGNGILHAAVSLISEIAESGGIKATEVVMTGGDVEQLHPYFPSAQIMQNAVLSGLEHWAAIETKEQAQQC